MTHGKYRAQVFVPALAIGALAFMPVAHAGGFAVRQQSVYYQGASYAGNAAGGDPSALFWNPATMTQIAGFNSETSLSGLVPYASNTPTSTTPGGLMALGGSGNIGTVAVVPASYYTYQVNPSLWVGLSINAPFGLKTEPPDLWAGYPFARKTDAKTYNFAPTVAYKINDMISVGAGVQIEYLTEDFNSGVPGIGPSDNVKLKGYGWGFGFTAGATVTPTPWTTIGLGWRSAIDQDVKGTLSVPAAIAGISTPGSVHATLKLPDIVTLSLRQRVSPKVTLLGSVEWANWSRIGTTVVYQASGAQAVVAGGGLALPFQYSDGWTVAVGAEYQFMPDLSLRSGIAFEKSPITDRVRTPRIPDADRIWLSFGLSYQVTNSIRLDLAYTHIFVNDANIAITAASGNPWYNPISGLEYTGTAKSNVDVISFGFKRRWDNPPPPLVTKG